MIPPSWVADSLACLRFTLDEYPSIKDKNHYWRKLGWDHGSVACPPSRDTHTIWIPRALDVNRNLCSLPSFILISNTEYPSKPSALPSLTLIVAREFQDMIRLSSATSRPMLWRIALTVDCIRQDTACLVTQPRDLILAFMRGTASLAFLLFSYFLPIYADSIHSRLTMEFAFALNVSIYGCTSCVQFPLIKPAVLVENSLSKSAPQVCQMRRLAQNPRPGSPKLDSNHDETEHRASFPFTRRRSNQLERQQPMFSPAEGGTLWNLQEQRKSCIPVYKCDYCRALYMLPLDVKETARKLGMVVGEDGLTDQGVRDYRGLNIGKKGEAEVYCFKTFVVMVCRPAKTGEDKLFCSFL